MLTIVDKPLIQYVGRRGEGSRHRAVHLRHRPQQERHRGSFRHAVRARRDAARARQEGRAGHPGAEPAGGRRGQLHPPAGAARPRPRGVVRARHRRRRAVRGACCPTSSCWQHAGCLKQMIETATTARRKSNVIAVEAVPDHLTHQYGICGVGKRTTARLFEVDGMVEKPAQGHRALQPLHHRPLHPPAGDLQDPGDAGARRRRRDPAHRRHDRPRQVAEILRRRVRGRAP